MYRLRPDYDAFSVAKLAIVPEHRGKGHGCRLMDWCVRYAKKQPNITYISLSSLPEAVRFYKRIGFRAVDVSLNQKDDDGVEFVEGQVYMEKITRGKGSRRKAR